MRQLRELFLDECRNNYKRPPFVKHLLEHCIPFRSFLVAEPACVINQFLDAGFAVINDCPAAGTCVAASDSEVSFFAGRSCQQPSGLFDQSQVECDLHIANMFLRRYLKARMPSQLAFIGSDVSDGSHVLMNIIMVKTEPPTITRMAKQFAWVHFPHACHTSVQ